MTSCSSAIRALVFVAAAFAFTVTIGAVPGVASAEVVDGRGYTIEITAPAASVGKSAAIRWTIRPKAGWKLNAEYPVKLEVPAVGALGIAAGTLKKSDAKSFAEKEAVFELPIKPTAKGEHQVAGKIKFATCTDTTCDPQKASFTAKVVVR